MSGVSWRHFHFHNWALSLRSYSQLKQLHSHVYTLHSGTGHTRIHARSFQFSSLNKTGKQVNIGCSVFCFWPELHQILTWKIWFRPMQRIFHGKKAPNLPDFKEKKSQNCQIFMISSSRDSQEYRRILAFPTFISSM